MHTGINIILLVTGEVNMLRGTGECIVTSAIQLHHHYKAVLGKVEL